MEKNRKPRGGKGGRPAKNDPAVYRFSVNFSAVEHARFLDLYEQSGLLSKAAFIKARVFNEAFRVVKTDRGTLEYVAKLTAFHAQFRAVGTNYNQVVKELHAHFPRRKHSRCSINWRERHVNWRPSGSRSCRSPKSSNNDGSQYHHRKRRVRRAGVQPGESRSGRREGTADPHREGAGGWALQRGRDGRRPPALDALALPDGKPVVHVSLNPAPEDRLDDGQLAEIAGAYMERMGWGGQPYIVFKHTDIGREHIHIVSVQVAQDGRKINDSRRNEHSVAVTEELEREYGLHPAKGRRREKGQGIVPADYTRGDLKRQVAAVIKPAVATYRFQTLGEFRALLSLYNIGIEEVRGERNGTPYRGLLYTLLDENGDKAVAAPLKSSLFGKEVGYDGLERHMERSAERFGKDDTRRQIRGRVDKALRGEPTEEELRERLREARVDLYIRRNENGRIVGVTFIDHETRTVVNGSRLGKAYSANAFELRFGGKRNPGENTRDLSPKQAPAGRDGQRKRNTSRRRKV